MRALKREPPQRDGTPKGAVRSAKRQGQGIHSQPHFRIILSCGRQMAGTPSGQRIGAHAVAASGSGGVQPCAGGGSCRSPDVVHAMQMIGCVSSCRVPNDGMRSPVIERRGSARRIDASNDQANFLLGR